MARLKLLYEDIMRPPEAADEISPSSTTAHSSVATSKEKSTSGKKTDEGKGKRDKSVKEKKCKAILSEYVQWTLSQLSLQHLK